MQRIGGPFYRGCLVSRELSDAADLWATLQDKAMNPERLGAILKATADTVNHMHREGVYHSDLNLKNILIREKRDRVEGYVIDFDKAQIILGQFAAAIGQEESRPLAEIGAQARSRATLSEFRSLARVSQFL